MNDKITILTPLFLNHHKLSMFEVSIKSFYDNMEKPYPLHIIKDDSPLPLHEEAKKIIGKINDNHLFLPRTTKTNGFEVIIELIDKVTTDYFFFIIDDAAMTISKDFITPIITHMEKNKKTIQVKIGGGVLCRPNVSNLHNITLNEDDTLYLNANKNVKWYPSRMGKDTIWTMELKDKNIKGEMAITYWNCVLRTNIFKKINNIIKDKKGKFKDKFWHDYQSYTNYGGDINDKVFNNGWPDGFEFLNNYDSGWLNMCCYIYPFGRSPIPYNIFKTTHTKEKK
jgi:hypothetical protein